MPGRNSQSLCGVIPLPHVSPCAKLLALMAGKRISVHLLRKVTTLLFIGIASNVLGWFPVLTYGQVRKPDKRVQKACANISSLVVPSAQFVSGLGPVSHRSVKPIKNWQEPDEVDTKETLNFPGIEVVLFRQPNSPAEIVELRFRRQPSRIQLPVAIGDSFAVVEKRLGREQRRTNTYVEYDCSVEEGATLRFYKRNARVYQIEWLNWPD